MGPGPPCRQSNKISLYLPDYTKACNKWAGPISASLRPCNTTPFEEMSQRWRAFGNTVSDLTGLRFEPQTSCFRDERVTARPTGRFVNYILLYAKMLKETENEETRLFWYIFIVGGISVGGGAGPMPPHVDAYDCNFNAICDIKILCAFLLVCAKRH